MKHGTLLNRACLITGASRGLGARIAEAFWQEGASLVLVSRSADALDALRSRLGRRAGQDIIAIEADLARADAVERIMDEVRLKIERMDVLVNNAAVQGPIGPLWTNDWSSWQETTQINFLSPARLCARAVPWMSTNGGGVIINISGGGAVSPRANFSAYASAKSALVRFSETLACETREMAIRVNCVAPGAMPTQMTRAVLQAGTAVAGEAEIGQAQRTQAAGDHVMTRAAALCAFLASDASLGITGKLISAAWDPWESFPEHLEELTTTDVYTQRRIVPADRNMSWDRDGSR